MSITIKPIIWSQPCKNESKSRYDHIIGNHPLGFELLLEWKSWKENDSVCLSIDDNWISSLSSIEEAKKVAQEIINIKINNSIVSNEELINNFLANPDILSVALNPCSIDSIDDYLQKSLGFSYNQDFETNGYQADFWMSWTKNDLKICFEGSMYYQAGYKLIKEVE